jgi:hypothetical protein
MLWGGADLALGGQDVSDLTIRLQPVPSITGQVMFRGSSATTRPDPSRINLRLAPATNATRPETISPAIVSGTGTFKFDGVIPGAYRLVGHRAGCGGCGAHLVARSAMNGGADVIDVPLVVGAGQDVSGIVITFTDAPTEIAGTSSMAAEDRFRSSTSWCSPRIGPAGRLTPAALPPSWPVTRRLLNRRSSSRRLLLMRAH